MSLTPVTFSLTEAKVKNLKEADIEKYGALPDEGVEATINYDFAANGAEADHAFGEAVCNNNRVFAFSHAIATKGRAALAEGVVGKKLQAIFYNEDKNERVWMPGVSAVRKTRAQKVADSLSKLSPEEKKREIELLQSKLKEQLAALSAK